jgi:NADH-quinone oxidoreductase subunit C
MSEDIISSLKSEFADSILNMLSEDEGISITVKKEESYDVLSSLKRMGLDHLSDVTCIDYIKEREFEIMYHLWSHQNKLRVNVKVRIPRDSPSTRSVTDLWAGAQIHERENHEMFGINFPLNPNLSPLFLEDWEEIPPLRKDFDTREFVRRKYYSDE